MAARTRTAIGRCEADIDAVIAAVVNALCPLATGLPLRTDGLASLPVNTEVLDAEAGRGACLPAMIMSRRSKELHAIFGGCRHEELRVEIAGVDDVDLRQQPLLLQGAMHARRNLAIGHGCGGCLDVGDQIWRIVFARLGEVHFITDPASGVLPPEVGIQIEDVGQELRCFGIPSSVVRRRTPVLRWQVVLHPDASQRIHGRHFPAARVEHRPRTRPRAGPGHHRRSYLPVVVVLLCFSASAPHQFGPGSAQPTLVARERDRKAGHRRWPARQVCGGTSHAPTPGD